MAEAERQFAYVAIDPSGKRARGTIAAHSADVAFERLRRQGLSPLTLKPGGGGGAAAGGGTRTARPARQGRLSEREVTAFLFDLAALLKAGADMRAALSLLAARSNNPGFQDLCRKLNVEISGGGALDRAFASALDKKHEFVAALIAAGEAAGDLAAGLQRSAELMEARQKLRDQLVSTLSYPGFILVTTIVAVFVILLFVVPSLAPLVDQTGVRPPLVLGGLMVVSNLLKSNLLTLAALAVALAVGLAVAARNGALGRWTDRALMDGPVAATASGFVFGGFATTLGNMLAAGAPMSEALKLAVRTVNSPSARKRLEPVVQTVRDGRSLSAALESVPRFPIAISRLAAVGEMSGALGPMLARGGRLEEDTAVRRLEAVVRIAGPALIVGLGGLIGLLMASLLSGVSEIGQSALQ